MKKKRLALIGIVGLAAFTMLFSGCGQNSTDMPPDYDPESGTRSARSWYTEKIRTREGAWIETNIDDAWDSDAKLGEHLFPEKYTLVFYGSDVTCYVDGAEYTKGIWEKNKGVLYIDFENGKSFVGKSYYFDEYNRSERMEIVDKQTDVCYSFTPYKNFEELEYQSKKSHVDSVISSYLTNTKYNLFDISGLAADGTHQYRSLNYDQNSYYLDFKSVDEKDYIYFNRYISIEEIETLVMEVNYKPHFADYNLTLDINAKVDETKSNNLYYKGIKFSMMISNIAGNYCVDSILGEFGGTSFTFKIN